MPDGVERGGGEGNDAQRHLETVVKSPDDPRNPESFAPLKSDESSPGVLSALKPPSSPSNPSIALGAASVKDPVIGISVNGYIVRGKLGAGGMGIVYSGDHPVIGKKAAIKVLRPEIAENEEQVKRLVSEARAVNAVGHRGIVDVFGYDTLPDGRQCIVMEYLDGEPLGDMVNRNRKEKRVMPIPQVLVVLEEILSALGAAHSAGVVHRDLKPSNIFLCKQRDGMSYVKLLDFGIAKLGVLGNTPQSRASMLVGTPSYMAPEQARGGAVTPAMDLYAVGIIAFEMLTGELPFTGESVVEVLMKHAEEPPPKPSSLLMSIPDDLDEIVVKLLSKLPEDRYQTADEVRDLITNSRKSLSESTARSIGLSLGRAIPRSGEVAAMATPASQPIPSQGTPAPRSLQQPPPPPHDVTRIKGETSEVPRVEGKKLPAEMVAATQAIPEGARYKGPAEPPKSSRGMLLGIIGLVLGVAALAVAFLGKQQQSVPVPVEHMATSPEPVKVEAPKPTPPAPEPVVAAPEPKPAEPVAKVEAPKPPPAGPKAVEPVAKVDAAKAPPAEPKKIEPRKTEPVAKVEAPKPAAPASPAEPKKAEPVKGPAKGDKLLSRYLSLDKQAQAKADSLPPVDKTILGKYLEALKTGSIKPEQREQAEVFANKIEAELKGQ